MAGKRVRRSAESWRVLVAKQLESGLSVAAFCARERLSAANFYQWRTRLGSGAVQAPAATSAAGGRLRGSGRIGRQRSPGAANRTRWWAGSAVGARLMFFPEGQVRVHVYGRPCDMRKSFDGLYALTKNELHQDPLSGRLFVFINRRGTQIKGICCWRYSGKWSAYLLINT